RGPAGLPREAHGRVRGALAGDRAKDGTRRRRGLERGEVVLRELDDGRPLAHGGRDALDRAAADVALGEDTGDARLEERRAPAVRVVGRVDVGSGQYEPLLVARHDAVEPAGVRLGPDQNEEA